MIPHLSSLPTPERNTVLISAFDDLTEQDRDNLDICADILISHVEATNPRKMLSYNGALELLSAVGMFLVKNK